jgi:hypothetical protein
VHLRIRQKPRSGHQVYSSFPEPFSFALAGLWHNPRLTSLCIISTLSPVAVQFRSRWKPTSSLPILVQEYRRREAKAPVSRHYLPRSDSLSDIASVTKRSQPTGSTSTVVARTNIGQAAHLASSSYSSYQESNCRSGKRSRRGIEIQHDDSEHQKRHECKRQNDRWGRLRGECSWKR